MSEPAEIRRAELATFLNSRRKRLRPEDVGLPTGSSRRRVVGLRREELAILAGVSPTWYTYLEQARAIQVSPQVLDSLARVLRLSEDERRYLHRLAYGYVVGPRTDRHIDESEFVRLLDHVRLETPTYVVNGVADLLAWNDACAEWYGPWRERNGVVPNMVHWLATDPLARQRLPDRDAVGADVVARVRAWLASDAAYTAHIETFADLHDQPDFARWWNGHDVSERHALRRVIRHPDHGPRTFELQPWLSGRDPGVAVVFHIPVEPTGRPREREGTGTPEHATRQTP